MKKSKHTIIISSSIIESGIGNCRQTVSVDIIMNTEKAISSMKLHGKNDDNSRQIH